MNASRVIRSAVAVACDAALGGSALGQIQFVEEDFGAGSMIVLPAVVGGNGGSGSVVGVATGGNPGGHAEISLTITGGAPPSPWPGSWSWQGALITNAVVAPSLVGGIVSVSASMQSAWVSGTLGPTVQTQGLLLRQSGMLFFAPMELTSTGGWTTHALSGQTAEDFRRIVSSGGVFSDEVRPDFSSGAAPIEIGFIRGNSNGGPQFVGYTNTSAIDNWSVTVTTGGVVPCPGDANGDRVVNFVDLNIVLSFFGQSVAFGTSGDVNGDGVVDFLDLNLVLSFFGTAC